MPGKNINPFLLLDLTLTFSYGILTMWGKKINDIQRKKIMNMKLAEERRKKRFMEARGGSVGEGYVRVNGEWVKANLIKVGMNKKEIEEIT